MNTEFAPISVRRRQAWLGGPATQPTFAMIKSHILYEDRVDEVLNRIRTEGFAMLLTKPRELSGDEITELYQEHLKAPYWQALVKSVSGPVLPMVLFAPNAVKKWRELLGSSNSMTADPLSLRGMYGSRITMANNVAHGSDSRQSADRELSIFFQGTISLRG